MNGIGMAMKKNEIYDIEIEDMSNDGEGIGHVVEVDEDGTETDDDADAGERKGTKKRGIAIFVKDTVVGDVVRIRVVKVKKQYAYGRLEEIMVPSPYRVEAKCLQARRCGGCTFMHMSYEKQLEYKWNKVRNCLERIGGVDDVVNRMETIYGMEEPYHYRNKMQFPVGLDKNGTVQIGFYAGRTHTIIDLEDCEIGHPINRYIINELRIWLQNWQNRTGDFIYEEKQHKGLVRHILTRVGFSTGELMVCVVINGKELPFSSSGKCSKGERHNGEYHNGGIDCSAELTEHVLHAVQAYNQAIEMRRTDMPENAVNKAAEKNIMVKDKDAGTIILKSLSININREKTNRILGDAGKTIFGNSYITDVIGDIQFHISPLSFYQVNPIQTKVLYDKVLEYADLSGEEIVWDMYCGIGTISLYMAEKAKKVYGVEIIPQAIQDARENARLNRLDNTEFFCGKAEEVVPEFYRNGENAGRHPDVVVVDPPRKGCDEVLLQTIVAMAPKCLVYVSCDPATLARDVRRLGEMGYKVRQVAVVDQFCHSGHVETVVLMSGKEK